MARKPSKLEEPKASAAAPPSDDEVRRRAYQIWEEEGRPAGREQEHWRRAQQELARSAGPNPTPPEQEVRSRAGAPPKARKQPGASAKPGGKPGAPATRGRGRAKPG